MVGRAPNAVKHRKDIADLKRRMVALEKVNKQLQARLAKIEAAQPVAPATEPAGRGWISGKGIRSLRKRLGLSQAGFAKLVGVSGQKTVYMWESKPGTLKLRGATKGKVLAVRGIGAREAKRRLEEMKAKKAPKKAARQRKKKR